MIGIELIPDSGMTKRELIDFIEAYEVESYNKYMMRAELFGKDSYTVKTLGERWIAVKALLDEIKKIEKEIK